MIELQSALVDIRAIGFADVDAEYDAFELKFFGQHGGQIAGENNLHGGGVEFVRTINISMIFKLCKTVGCKGRLANINKYPKFGVAGFMLPTEL